MSDRQQLIKVLFHAVAELETDEARHAFLDDQCSDNAQLKQEVLGLFAHDRQLSSFMERKQEQAVMAMAMPSEDSFHESIDETIGPYKLREKLGVGGMGIVYVAEQTEPVHRKVALKIIKPGMDSKEVLARFVSEIRKKGRSTELRLNIDVRHDSDFDGVSADSDSPIAGVVVVISVYDSNNTIVRNFLLTTNAQGTGTTYWYKLPGAGNYHIEVHDLSLAGFYWDPLNVLESSLGDRDLDGRPDLQVSR